MIWYRSNLIYTLSLKTNLLITTWLDIDELIEIDQIIDYILFKNQLLNLQNNNSKNNLILSVEFQQLINTNFNFVSFNLFSSYNKFFLLRKKLWLKINLISYYHIIKFLIQFHSTFIWLKLNLYTITSEIFKKISYLIYFPLTNFNFFFFFKVNIWYILKQLKIFIFLIVYYPSYLIFYSNNSKNIDQIMTSVKSSFLTFILKKKHFSIIFFNNKFITSNINIIKSNYLSFFYMISLIHKKKISSFFNYNTYSYDVLLLNTQITHSNYIFQLIHLLYDLYSYIIYTIYIIINFLILSFIIF